MTAASQFLDQSMDKMQSAWKSVEEEVQKVQKQIEVTGTSLNQRAEKQIKQFQKDFRTYPGVQRAESLGEDLKKEVETRLTWVSEQMDSSLVSVLGGLQIASRTEIDKLDRKLNRINRRLKALDKAISEKAQTEKS
ncbi:MAG: hypothetical protein CL917_10050 [Deltaproteobacteria bacterium]|nr:hypothetical protein [Deltaproteobacteria bacterium]